MGISDRKEREKEDLKKLILDAARDIFLRKGFENTSVRNIAEIIEYSPTTIYLYFKDKDEIFHALHTDGFNKLNGKMAVLLSVADPFERLKAMGKIYIDFALNNQEFYDLMFIQKAPINFLESVLEPADEQPWDEGVEAFSMLKTTLYDCREKKYLEFDDVETTAFVVWSTLHGMVSLQIRQRCNKVICKENWDSIVDKGYLYFVHILESMKPEK